MEKTPPGDIMRENMELRQKVALLEKENREMIEREDNLKAINNQVLEALATFGSSSNGFSKEEIGILEEQYKKEIESMSQQISQERTIHQKEKENSADKIIELENENWRIKAQMEALVEEQERVNILFQEESEKNKQKQRNAENSYRLKEEERLRLESKVRELELQTEREKRNDENQREALIKELESNLDGIKIIHEHEKQVLWTKMNGLQSERSIVQTASEQHQNLYAELRKQMKADREEHDRKLSEMRSHIVWLENENGKILILEKKIESHEEELKRKDIVFHEMKWKLQEKITELRLNLKKAEQKEKNCLVTLQERDSTLEEIKKDFSRRLALEKLRGDNLQDAAKKIKEDYTRKNAFIIQEILSKEEIVKKLQKELYKQEVALSRATTNTTSSNITRTHHNSCSLWTDQNNNSVQNQSQPLFEVRKIGNTGHSLSNSNMSNLSFYNSIQSNLMNTELVPDLTLFSNNVPSLSNNQTFINQFAKTFASPKTQSETKIGQNYNNSIAKRDSQFQSVQNENEDVIQKQSKQTTQQLIKMQSNLKQRRSDIRDKRSPQQDSIENRRNTSNVTELGSQNVFLSEKNNQNSSLRNKDVNKSEVFDQFSSRKYTAENTPNHHSKVLKLNSSRTDKQHRKPESAGQVGQFFQCTEEVFSEKNRNIDNTNKTITNKPHDIKTVQAIHSGLRSPSFIKAHTPSNSPISSKNNNLKHHHNSNQSTQPLSNGSSYQTLTARSRIPSQYTGSSINGVSNQESMRTDIKRQSIVVNTAQKKQSSVSCHMNNSIISFINTTEQEDQENHSFEQSRFFQGSIQQTSKQAQFNYDSQGRGIPSSFSSARTSQDCFHSLLSPFNSNQLNSQYSANEEQRRQTNDNGMQNAQVHSNQRNQLQEINPFDYESYRVIPSTQNSNKKGHDSIQNNNTLRQHQKSPLNLRDLNCQVNSVNNISSMQADKLNHLETQNISHFQSVQLNSTYSSERHSQSAYGTESTSKNQVNSYNNFPKAPQSRVNTLSIHLERPLDGIKEIATGTQQQQSASQTPLVRCIQLF